MPYSITTKDGITINNIPDEVAPDSQELKDRVSSLRGEAKPSTVKQIAKGALVGASDIGNTLINAATFIPRQMTPELDQWNTDREASLKGYVDENKDSGAFTAGRIGANIAGTAGVGGLLGKGVQGLSQSPRVLQLAKALETGGMSANGAGMGTRILGGAITGGASAGLVNPEDTLTGAVVGGALPPAVKAAHAVGKGATSGIKSLVEPFYEGGREQILGRALRAAAGNQADDAVRSLTNAAPVVPGSLPTAGMVSGSPGIAALERAAVANNPVATNELALRQAANSEARQSALSAITPDKEVLIPARDSAAEALYGTAMNSDAMRLNLAKEQAQQLKSVMQGSPVPSPDLVATPGIKDLMSRPAFRAALSDGKTLASDLGEEFAPNSLKSLHYAKLAIDDALNGKSGTGSALSNYSKTALSRIKSQLLGEMETISPAYRNARLTYQDMSRPINQADVLEEIATKATNFRGDLTPAAFAKALSDTTAQRATGRTNATLDSILDPEQLDVLNNIKDDLLNQDFAQTAGRGVGSNTVQNLAYTNMMNRFGVPSSLSGSPILGSIGNIAGRAGDVAYKRANERLAAELADVLLDPQRTGKVMQEAAPRNITPEVQRLIEMLNVGASRSAPILAIQR